MADEKKVYRIGGRNYEMPPLTVGQEEMIGPWRVTIGKTLSTVTAAEREAFNASGNVGVALFHIALDSMALWSNPDTRRALAVMLVREGDAFDKSAVDGIFAEFEKAQTAEFDEVLADFFLKAIVSGGVWMRLLTVLRKEKKLPDNPLESENPQ